MPAAQPNHDMSLLEFTITLDGRAISDTVQVVSIVARAEASRPARLELVVDAASAGSFKAGGAIDVKVNHERIFEGVVDSVSDFTQGEDRRVRIVAEDALAGLRHKRISRAFVQNGPEAILQVLLDEAGLSCKAPATEVVFEQYLVIDQSILDACRQLAADAGWLFRCEEKTVTFFVPDDTPAPVLSCAPGESLLHFSGAAREVPESIKFQSWDVGTSKVLAQEQTVKAERKTAPVVRQATSQDVAVLSFLAKGAARELQALSFAGDGAIFGSTKLSVGARIELRKAEHEGVVTAFPPGEYLVTACEHRVENGEHVTNFSVGLDQPLPRPPAAPAPLLLGVVARVDEDPMGLDRIHVTLPTLMRAGEGIWAHVLVPHSGFYFPHEPGDQVLLSFLPGDFSMPVVLGGLPTRQTRNNLGLPQPTAKRETAHLVYGNARLKLTGGNDTDPAGASLSGPTYKVEFLEGKEKDSGMVLEAGPKASLKMKDSSVSLKADNSTLDLDAAGLVARVEKLEALAKQLMTLKSDNALDLQSAQRLDVKSGVVSINGDALKVI